jgi:integrase
MRAQRYKRGSVRFDKRRGTWNYLFYDNGTRRSKRIGTKQQYPTKAAAWKAAEKLNHCTHTEVKTSGPLFAEVIARYQSERMPARHSTARVYRSFISTHIVPKWGGCTLAEIQPRPVELWLKGLSLSPKSKTHVRSLLYGLMEFAMWAGLIEAARNPISLVQNKGATRRTRKARSLTVEQFHTLLSQLREPFSTIALLCVCLGLRISEALALRWADVDWLGSRLAIKWAIVEQVVDEVKTEGSAKTLTLAEDLLSRLKAWKQVSPFPEAHDWIFASPLKHGRLPYSYTGVWRELERATIAAGIGHLGTHSFRHTYRSWLDAVGTSIGVQQRMMRHCDIRTTMNIYGDVVTDEMSTASARVAKLAFRANGAQAERGEA